MRFAIAAAILMLLAVSAVACAADPTPQQRHYAAQLLMLINAHRAQYQLAPLQGASHLDKLAYEHSVAMAKAGKMSHEGFRERGLRSESTACVENVGWNYATPEAMLKAWIESPGHNQNMLDPKVTKAGTGDADAYVTFIACR
jgi:uncharacterized protein YkwD